MRFIIAFEFFYLNWWVRLNVPLNVTRTESHRGIRSLVDNLQVSIVVQLTLLLHIGECTHFREGHPYPHCQN